MKTTNKVLTTAINDSIYWANKELRNQGYFFPLIYLQNFSSNHTDKEVFGAIHDAGKAWVKMEKSYEWTDESGEEFALNTEHAMMLLQYIEDVIKRELDTDSSAEFIKEIYNR